jgi:Ca-activated chloride channel family protein
VSLLAPIALQTVLAVAGVLAGLTVVAYILKMRRRRFEVPFSALWQRVLKEKETQTLFKQLRRLLSLLLQLVILALLLLAVLDPRLGAEDRDARNVVIILDASASMKAMDERPGGAAPAENGTDGESAAEGGAGTASDGDDGDGDGGPRVSRMEVAREQARELLDAMGGGDMAMIVRMDGQTTPLSRFDDDMARLKRLVAGVEASDTPADLARALTAAADALRGRKNPMIILIGDGAYPGEVRERVIWEPLPAAAPADARLDAIDLSGPEGPIDVRFVPVGVAGDNAGIVAFNARRYLTDKTSYAVFVEVQNFGEQPATRKLVVYSGDSAVDVKTLSLAPGERLRQLYPNLGGGQGNRLRAELQPADTGGAGAAEAANAGTSDARPDVFPLDDRAYALLPARKKQNVLLVTRDNLYLEGAMLVYDNIQVDKLTPEEYDRVAAGGTLPAYDAVAFDDHAPATLPPPPTHLVYFGARGEHSPFPVRRMVSAPRITEVNDSHPVMRWVVLSDVNFDESAVLGVDPGRGDVVLASYVRDPIIAARRDGARKIVSAGFSLAGTDLTLRVAFPLLLVNALDWFAGDDADLVTTYRTGQRFRVPLDGVYGVPEVDVELPDRRHTRAPVSDGHASFYGHTIGIHRLIAREDGQVVAQVELAANLANPAESQVAPQRALALGGKDIPAPEGFRITVRRTLWLYLALAALALLCIEWLTYHRRITV